MRHCVGEKRREREREKREIEQTPRAGPISIVNLFDEDDERSDDMNRDVLRTLAKLTNVCVRMVVVGYPHYHSMVLYLFIRTVSIMDATGARVHRLSLTIYLHAIDSGHVITSICSCAGLLAH